MSRFWSPIVHQLAPYTPGEQPQDRSYVKLNTNENPYPPSPRVSEALKTYEMDRLRLYPDPVSGGLVRAIATHFETRPERVFVGNGSDEVLAHCFKAFFGHQLPLLFPDITYSFYPVYCGLFGVDFRTIPLRDDLSIAISDYTVANGGIIFPNPNAPTSRLLTLDAIEQLCQWHADSVIVVDEAYIDFGGQSAIPLTGRYDNLLVIQTFSKSRCLAGLRIGYAIGHPDLIDGLNRVKDSFNSYPLDALAQVAGIAAIEDQAYFENCCRMITDSRDSLSADLTGLGFKVLPSAANFVFAHHPDAHASALYQALKQSGVLVRYFGKPRIDNYLRITIGTPDECRALTERLRTILARI